MVRCVRLCVRALEMFRLSFLFVLMCVLLFLNGRRTKLMIFFIITPYIAEKTIFLATIITDDKLLSSRSIVIRSYVGILVLDLELRSKGNVTYRSFCQ
jgi:hypothetical protein